MKQIGSMILLTWTTLPWTAAATVITLNEAMDAAANRQELAAARAEAEAARRDAETIRRSASFPQIEAMAGYQELDEARELSTPFGPLELGEKGTAFTRLEIRQPLVDPETRGHKAPAAGLAADARGLEAERLGQRLAAEAGLAFLQVLRIDARLETTRAFIASLDGRTRQVGDLVAEGRALQADLLKIHLDRDDAKLEEFRLLRLREVALENLGRAMGIDESVEPVFDAELLEFRPEAREAAVDRAWQSRPDLRALAVQIEALERQAKGVRAEGLPRLDASLKWEYLEASSFTENAFVEGTLAVTWKPFASGTRQTRSASFEATRRAVDGRLHEAKRGAAVEVRAALADLETAVEAIRVRESDVRQAEETLRVESERYVHGRSTLDDVLEYEAVLRERTTLRELAELDFVAARIRYGLAVGE